MNPRLLSPSTRLPADGRARFAQARAFSINAAHAVVHIDLFLGDAEPDKWVALSGEVLLVGGAADTSDETSESTEELLRLRGILALQDQTEILPLSGVDCATSVRHCGFVLRRSEAAVFGGMTHLSDFRRDPALASRAPGPRV